MLPLLLLLGAATATPIDPAVLAYSVPEEVSGCLEQAEKGYSLNPGLNPFYLRGDFDGDGKADHAVAVIREEKHGVLFCWGGARTPTALGAGRPFIKMDDLSFTGWRIHAKSKKVQRGAQELPPPRLRGDAIVIEWQEAASGLVYWAGDQFGWYQRGD
jgi:hypothetical protein